MGGFSDGGSETFSEEGAGISNVDTGASVVEYGVGAVGGGLCMNVKSSSSSVTSARGFLVNGSGTRKAGREDEPCA